MEATAPIGVSDRGNGESLSRENGAVLGKELECGTPGTAFVHEPQIKTAKPPL